MTTGAPPAAPPTSTTATAATATAAAAPAAPACKEHPARAALWRCVACHQVFCQDCVKVRAVEGRSYEVCNACGGMCEDLRAVAQDAARKAGFFDLLPSAFSYPVSGTGIVFLILGVLFFGAMRLLSFSLMGKLFGILGAGYLVAWLFKIINESARGSSAMADWPDFTNLYDDIVEPLRAMAVTTLIAFGPAGACILLGFFAHGFFFALSVPLFIAGGVYYPMALLATGLQTRLALYPAVIFSSIGRVIGPYAAACGVLIAAGAVFSLAGLLVQILSPVLGSLLAFGTSIYLSLVEARMLGLLYYTSKERLGWL